MDTYPLDADNVPVRAAEFDTNPNDGIGLALILHSVSHLSDLIQRLPTIAYV